MSHGSRHAMRVETMIRVQHRRDGRRDFFPEQFRATEIETENAMCEPST